MEVPRALGTVNIPCAQFSFRVEDLRRREMVGLLIWAEADELVVESLEALTLPYQQWKATVRIGLPLFTFLSQTMRPHIRQELGRVFQSWAENQQSSSLLILQSRQWLKGENKNWSYVALLQFFKDKLRIDTFLQLILLHSRQWLGGEKIGLLLLIENWR